MWWRASSPTRSRPSWHPTWPTCPPACARRGPRTERQAAQLRLLSHPALHGAPLLVVGAETDVDSYGGALARGAAAYVSSAASPPEIRDLALRLVRAADRRRAEGRTGAG